ncbi:MAG: hypothetical protein ACFCD0_05515 [Gemmataceae bacterium]
MSFIVVGMIVLAVIGLVASIVIITTVQSMNWLTQPMGLFEPVNHIRNSFFLDDVDWTDDWAFRNGYDFDSYYHFQCQRGLKAKLAAWYNPDTKAGLLLAHIGPLVIFEFASYYEDGTEVNTSDHGDSLMLPPAPGVYNEAFPKATLDELHWRHFESRAFLEEVFELPHARSQTMLTSLEESTYSHASYVKTIPFWWLRSLYWYFIRRPALKNKSIAAQLGEPDWRRQTPHDNAPRFPEDSSKGTDERFRADDAN